MPQNHAHPAPQLPRAYRTLCATSLPTAFMDRGQLRKAFKQILYNYYHYCRKIREYSVALRLLGGLSPLVVKATSCHSWTPPLSASHLFEPWASEKSRPGNRLHQRQKNAAHSVRTCITPQLEKRNDPVVQKLNSPAYSATTRNPSRAR